MTTKSFERQIARHGLAPLVRTRATTLQVNVGRRCNQACRHCHVDAGPQRTEEMSLACVERLLGLLDRSPRVEVVDITGGAPELHPGFRRLAAGARARERRVIDRCNLTVLEEPGQEDTAAFLAEQGIDVVASLPCYSKENVERQRGRGVFDRSIEALRLLNRLGYGIPGSALRLDLVYNPLTPSLPPAQEALEALYREELRAGFGVEFHRLLTLTNMPIKRFAAALERSGQHEAYMALLVESFNPEAVDPLMCRTQVSVGHDGQLYDCDFNQMLELPLAGKRRTIWEIDTLDDVVGERIETAEHCFGCTAGSGSSCGGATARSAPERNRSAVPLIRAAGEGTPHD